MRDIPFFSTQNGVAGLCLKEIPYTQSAYITLYDTSDVAALLDECISFCRAAGASKIFASGNPYLAKFPLHTVILQMFCEKERISPVNAMALSADKESLRLWREIYNKKMQSVHNAAYMRISDCEAALDKGELYFVYEENILIGIGAVNQEYIRAVASVVSGKGQVVLSALCQKIHSDVIRLEVALENEKAVRLYTQMGFQTEKECSCWYHVK